MPPERIILAASSTVIERNTTFSRGTKQMNPVGGTMPVGMKTVSRSLVPPGATSLISPDVSPVTKTRLQISFDGNSIIPTFWKLWFGPVVEITLSKICFSAP